jgi:hypothetical protein
MLSTTALNRSKRNIFIPRDIGPPHDSLMAVSVRSPGSTSSAALAGEVIYRVEGDSTPVSQQDEEARIATLAYAIKKLGNPEDAAECMRCLNAICEEGDARYRQVAASYYYNEIAGRGAGPGLKEMALIAIQLTSLNPVMEAVEDGSEIVAVLSGESKPRSLFDREVAAVERMIGGRRKIACFAHDEWTQWWNDLEAMRCATAVPIAAFIKRSAGRTTRRSSGRR